MQVETKRRSEMHGKRGKAKTKPAIFLPDEGEAVFTAKEAQAILRCGNNKLLQLEKEGHLKVERFDRRRRYKASELRRFLQRQEA